MEQLITSDKLVFSMSLSKDVYSLSVCKKASYALMNLVSCEISISQESIDIKVLRNNQCELSESELELLILDELLDYSLREEISDKTEHIRTVILSNAFSNTKLVG